jgi:hypothetical protein
MLLKLLYMINPRLDLQEKFGTFVFSSGNPGRPIRQEDRRCPAPEAETLQYPRIAAGEWIAANVPIRPAICGSHG